jgi:uncharacterized damage-inducible protein DinB
MPDMTFLADEMQSLARTPAILREIVLGRPDSWLDAKHEPDVDSPREALVHIIRCDRDLWIQRIRIILEQSDNREGDADHQDDNLDASKVEDLLAEFWSLREERLRELESLQLSESDLAKTGTSPKFGRITVDQIIATWVAHDLYHLGQIFKSFSSLYRERVGPWQEFLNLPHFN